MSTDPLSEAIAIATWALSTRRPNAREIEEKRDRLARLDALPTPEFYEDSECWTGRGWFYPAAPEESS